MALELLDFIRVEENVLDENVCKKLIEYFDTHEPLHERVDNDKIPNFTQLNFTINSKENEEIENLHHYLISKTFEYRDKYYAHVGRDCFPKEHQFEQFRIKKYQANTEDQFDTHIDVTDHSSAKRFLSFMWYLNDVEDGGETEFADILIKPQCGKLLIFPPLWLFPHKGHISRSNDKYILSTYLHYK